MKTISTIITLTAMLFLAVPVWGDEKEINRSPCYDTPEKQIEGVPCCVKPKEKSTREFVTMLYKTILNRKPDHGGLNAWSIAIDCGYLSRLGAIIKFLESEEYVKRLVSEIGKPLVQQWEYEILKDHEIQQIWREKGIHGLPPDDKTAFNVLGLDGWEHTSGYIFKRPKQVDK